jgi:hypothetical protein
MYANIRAQIIDRPLMFMELGFYALITGEQKNVQVGRTKTTKSLPSSTSAGADEFLDPTRPAWQLGLRDSVWIAPMGIGRLDLAQAARDLQQAMWILCHSPQPLDENATLCVQECTRSGSSFRFTTQTSSMPAIE